MANKILMIDTCLLIDYFRKKDKAKTRLVQLANKFSRIAISSITEYEIYGGATLDQIKFWQELLTTIEVIPFDSKAALAAVEIEKDLKKQRKSIEKADLFIASIAVANNLFFDTLNRKHFEKIEKLNLLEN